MLTIENLCVGYNKQILIDSFSIEIGKENLIAVLGKNGSGKSTLLKTLMGIEKPLSGTVLWNNSLPTSQQEIAKIASIVLTDIPFSLNLNVETIVSTGRYPHTGILGNLSNTDKKIIHAALNQLNIGHLRHKKIHTISDGERQKVMIAKAITQNTPVILLDEPTSFLDVANKIEISALLKELAKEKLIIYTTHDLNFALKESNQLWVVNQSKLITGKATEILSTSFIQEVYQTEKISYNPIENQIEFNS